MSCHNGTFIWSQLMNIIRSGSALCVIGMGMVMGCSSNGPVLAAQGEGLEYHLKNSQISWRGSAISGKLGRATIIDAMNSQRLQLKNPCFRILLGNGKTITSADCVMVKPPAMLPLAIDRQAPKLAEHFAGDEFVADLLDKSAHLYVIWTVRLRRGGNYLREHITLRTTAPELLVKRITLLNQRIQGAQRIGTVPGSPIVAGNFFLAYENPMANNTVSRGSQVRCAMRNEAILRPGQEVTGSCVIGVAPPDHLRRGFMEYLNMERCHPYRPFLHYNSWYDIGNMGGKYDAAQCVHAINRIGTELVLRRGVKLNSFLFDDGWDNNKTLWEFNSGFPDGFTPLDQAAAKYHAGVGVWLSPWGGYGVAKQQRLKYGKARGFETNAYGFDLAGPKYYHRFRSICLKMIQKYHVNIFKFDGVAAGDSPVLAREGEAMLRLDRDLRKAEPNLYISQTTGTWASPFWLLYADSIWRGGMDHAYEGPGSLCQQWITYRDAQTYQNIVLKGPLYPLNSLMLHGIIYARYAKRLDHMSDAAFADQVWSFFGTGTQLQELYITPHLLNHYDWDVLARAAKWARANAAILADTHWIGGNPAKGEIYGWAAWRKNKGMIVLRNPAASPARFTADVGKLFDLPPHAQHIYRFTTPRKHAAARAVVTLHAGIPHTFILKAFQVLVLQSGGS
jgi:hypothetical protein